MCTLGRSVLLSRAIVDSVNTAVTPKKKFKLRCLQSSKWFDEDCIFIQGFLYFFVITENIGVQINYCAQQKAIGLGPIKLAYKRKAL